MTYGTEYTAGPLTRNAGRNALIGLSIGLLIVLVIVVSVVVVVKVFGGRDLVSSSFTESLGELQSVETHINFGRGSLTIDALPTGDTELIEATFETVDQAAKIALDRSGTKGILNISDIGRDEDAPTYLWSNAWRNPPAEWNIHLSSGPSTSLIIRRTDDAAKRGPENRVWLDLRDLQVTSLYAGIDGAEITIFAPSNAGHVDMRLEVSTRNMLIVIPEGVAGRINKYTNTGYQLEIDTQRFPREDPVSGAGGAVYESPGFETAENRVSIDLFELGGPVRIQ